MKGGTLESKICVRKNIVRNMSACRLQLPIHSLYSTPSSSLDGKEMVNLFRGGNFEGVIDRNFAFYFSTFI